MAPPAEHTLRLSDRVVDLQTGEVSPGGKLRPIELRLLRYLAERAEHIVGRDELLTEVWGYSPAARTNTLYTTWHRLKGVLESDPSSPKHLFTLPGRGLRLGGVLTTAAPVSNIRRPEPPHLGRDRELAFLSTCPARVVVVTGPAGSGKTRLAIEHASSGAPGRERWLVEVQDAQGEADLVDAICQAVGLGAQPAPQLGLALARRGPLLLILDDAEAAAEHVAALVPPWVQAAPELRVLVTSRVPLGLRDAHRLPLRPLALGPDGPAAQLLRHRVRACSPLNDDDHDEADLVGILEEADGLPLAIEIIAPHVAALGATAVLDALRRHQALPTPAADRRSSHQSLHAMVRWSWGALPAWAAPFVRQLLAFRGPFPLAAAEVVVTGPDVRARLTQLVDRGLVVPSQTSGRRLRLLNTVRAVAGPVDPAARRRHLDHYLALARSRYAAGDGMPPATSVDLDDALELLRAARTALSNLDMPGVDLLLAYAAATAVQSGRRQQGQRLVSDALDQELPTPCRVRLRAFLATSQAPAVMLRLLGESATEARDAGLPLQAIHLESRFAGLQYNAGQYEEARRTHVRLGALVAELPARPAGPRILGQARCDRLLAALSPDAEALVLVLRCLAGLEGLGPSSARGMAWFVLAQYRLWLGDLTEAQSLLERALSDLPARRWPRAQVQALLGEVLAHSGRSELALAHAEAAVAIVRRTSPPAVVRALEGRLAETLRVLGQLEQAACCAQRAQVGSGPTGTKRHDLFTVSIVALVAKARGQRDAMDLLCHALHSLYEQRWFTRLALVLAAVDDLVTAGEADPGVSAWLDRLLEQPDVGFAAAQLVLIRLERLRARGHGSAVLVSLTALEAKVPEPLVTRVRLARAAVAAEAGQLEPARVLTGRVRPAAASRWTRIHRARCLAALGDHEAAAAEIVGVTCQATEHVLARALGQLASP